MDAIEKRLVKELDLAVHEKYKKVW